MIGAFQTSREIFENPIWQDVTKFRIFFYIYGKAVFAEEGAVSGGIKLERGQYLRSYRNLAKDLEYIDNRSIKQYSLSMISRKINELVSENRLKIKDTELGTLFTVVNYAQYQGLDNYRKHNENGDRTAKEQQKNSKGTEKERRRNNNNNGNKDNNDIKDIYMHWNSLKITVHRELTKITESKINARLKKMTVDEIKEAITNYNSIYKDDRYWYTHKFTLDKFIEPKNIEQFLTENEPHKKFLKEDISTKFNSASTPQRPSKPQIPIVADREIEISDEEYQEMLEVAKKLG